jgi:hypothetical protein
MSHEVGKTEVRLLVRFDRLLAEHVEPQVLTAPPFIAPHDDVIAVLVCRPKSVDGAWREKLLGDDAVEQRAAVIVELSRGGAVTLVVEDLRELPFEIPGRKEESPVDVAGDLFEADVIDDLSPFERRHGHIFASPLDRRRVFPRNVEGNQLAVLPMLEQLPRFFLLASVLRIELHPALGAQKRGHDVDYAGRVENVHRAALIRWRNLDGGVRPTGRRASD